MPTNRTTVLARRSLAQTVADAFLPLEQIADQTAVVAHRCVATLLEQRAAAGLSVTAGEEAIAAIQEGCRHSYAAQASFRRAHQMFPDLMIQHGITGYAPECDLTGQASAPIIKLAG